MPVPVEHAAARDGDSPPPAGGAAGCRTRRRAGRRTRAAVALALVAPAGWAGWLALDAHGARGDLLVAQDGVDDLQRHLLARDLTAAGATLSTVQEHTARARDRIHGPHWTAAGAVPSLGETVRAVQTVTEVVDDLAIGALPALVGAGALADPATLAPVDGRVDLAPLTAAAPAVVAADRVVQRAVDDLRAIDADAVVPAVAAEVADLRARLGTVATTTAHAARAVRLLPPMLGAQGPRHYLLLVQNNAELRATGGIPGSVVLLRAEDGAIDVVEQRTGGSLGDLDAPVLPLTAAEQAIFGPDLAADMRDVTFTPHFPRSGEIAREIWQQHVGTPIDGVLSVDPGALAHVLGATGPVTLPTGQRLDADNAVRLLLNEVYLDVEDPAAQDQFFASTAETVFDAVLAGQGDVTTTVDALVRSAGEGRLMVWSVHPEEQALLAGTVLSGELTGVRGESPVVGLYFNDAIPAKMGYYLRSDVAAVPTGCASDGAPTFTVTVDLTSTAPADAAALPAYVAGTEAGFPRGDLRTNVLLYAPQGGRVETVRVSAGDPGVFAQTHDGLAVVGRTVQLSPGGTVRIEYDVVAGPGQSGALVLRTTPMVSGTTSVERVEDCS